MKFITKQELFSSHKKFM